MSSHLHPEIQCGLSSARQPDVLPQLLHEVRQPLCGIESIAYYLEIALDGQDESVRRQCGNIRSMVRQASWLLDDAAIGAAAHNAAPGTVCPNGVVLDIAERLALHDERPLHLDLPRHAPTVRVNETLLRRILEHVLCFFHDVAEASKPVRIGSRPGQTSLSLLISGAIHPDRRRELTSLFESLRPGGLAAALAAIGGHLEISSTPGCLEVALLLPTVPHD
ncbi:MAG: hypothetical protein C0504_14020 [Candidatus Solibacter sp.]|nr:hypothetical protein [Candidatus Solibacter sp.]